MRKIFAALILRITISGMTKTSEALLLSVVHGLIAKNAQMISDFLVSTDKDKANKAIEEVIAQAVSLLPGEVTGHVFGRNFSVPVAMLATPEIVALLLRYIELGVDSALPAARVLIQQQVTNALTATAPKAKA